jgi:hypothetical protein
MLYENNGSIALLNAGSGGGIHIVDRNINTSDITFRYFRDLIIDQYRDYVFAISLSKTIPDLPPRLPSSVTTLSTVLFRHAHFS